MLEVLTSKNFDWYYYSSSKILRFGQKALFLGKNPHFLVPQKIYIPMRMAIYIVDYLT